MEKRQISFPPNNAKKIKLDALPGKCDPGPSTSIKDPIDFDDNTWDNEQIDEMILMASQVYEVQDANQSYNDIFTANEAFEKSVRAFSNGDVKSSNENDPLRDVANYIINFKPPLTSTQRTVVCHSGTFKQPQPIITTTYPSDKVLTVASSSKSRASGDFIQSIQELQAALAKKDQLNAQLQDDYISKEGEVAILRSQLKSAQSAVNAERMQKVKIEERKMAEYNEIIKLKDKELKDIKTKMEFQDLEVSKLKEKCRILEKGSKIKLTLPSAPVSKPKWPSFSQKMDASILNESHVKKTENTSITVRNPFQPIRLNVSSQKEYPLQTSIPECIYHHHTMKDIPVEYKSNREPLFVEHSSFVDIRRRILEEFKCDKAHHSTINDSNNGSDRSNGSLIDNGENKTDKCTEFNAIYQDLSMLVKMSSDELKSRIAFECALRICDLGSLYLRRVLARLKELSKKVSPHTVVEMDEAYMAYMMNSPDTMATRNIFHSSPWCDNEQAIDARRIISVIAKLSLYVTNLAEYICGIRRPSSSSANHSNEEVKGKTNNNTCLLDMSLEVCSKIDYTGCSQKYPGLLSAVSMLVDHCVSATDKLQAIHTKIFDFCKCILMLRPNCRCVSNILSIFAKLSHNEKFLRHLCKGGGDNNNTNMLIDYSQGVVLCDSESCVIQLLCTQLEVWSSHLSLSLETGAHLAQMTQFLLNLCDAGTHHNMTWTQQRQEDKMCSCRVRIYQCVTVCLHKTAKLYFDFDQIVNDDLRRSLNQAICCGLIILKSSLRDPDFLWKLKDYEGHYQMFVHIVSQLSQSRMELHTWHKDALVELKNTMALIANTQTPNAEAESLLEDMQERFLLTD